MKNIRRKLFSQNFLCNRQLVERLVSQSSLGQGDLVVEIGAGQGIITRELIRRAGHVIAVEIDGRWFGQLQGQLAGVENLTLYQADILNFDLPRLPYKIFANIPFAIEGKIIRKLLDDANPPQDCYLVVMKELAERLIASHPGSLFASSYRPWFDVAIVHRFSPADFSPVPHVKAVLLRFTKKSSPLLPWPERKKYQQFIQRGFGQGRSIRHNLRGWYKTDKIDTALQKISISRKCKPGHLRIEQWIRLYNALV